MHNKTSTASLVFYFFFFLTVIFFGFRYYQQILIQQKSTVIINKKLSINVEIADTEEKRVQGLSGREKLNNNEGMLFIFNHPDFYSFWMKDMKFDLDFVWIRNNKIVDIIQNISHNKQEVIYRPTTLVDEVLEVKAGFVEKNGIKIGGSINTN